VDIGAKSIRESRYLHTTQQARVVQNEPRRERCFSPIKRNMVLNGGVIRGGGEAERGSKNTFFSHGYMVTLDRDFKNASSERWTLVQKQVFWQRLEIWCQASFVNTEKKPIFSLSIRTRNDEGRTPTNPNKRVGSRLSFAKTSGCQRSLWLKKWQCKEKHQLTIAGHKHTRKTFLKGISSNENGDGRAVKLRHKEPELGMMHNSTQTGLDRPGCKEMKRKTSQRSRGGLGKNGKNTPRRSELAGGGEDEENQRIQLSKKAHRTGGIAAKKNPPTSPGNQQKVCER